MRKVLGKAAVVMLLFNSCQGSREVPKTYPRMIGDIAYEAEVDNPQFKLCNDENMAVQYYAFTKILGEKPHAHEKGGLEAVYRAHYDPEIAKKESGLLRIRFLVNCEGRSGRFRMIGMDKEYQEKEFDASIAEQLRSITEKRVEWKPFKTGELQRDYYMYLIFKIENGEIIEILP